MEKSEFLCTIGRNIKWFSHDGKSYNQKIKNRITTCFINSTSGYKPKRIKTKSSGQDGGVNTVLAFSHDHIKITANLQNNHQ